jgi:hypothetical protein
VIDAKDFHETIGNAAQMPATRVGTVEVRLIMEIAGLPPNKKVV